MKKLGLSLLVGILLSSSLVSAQTDPKKLDKKYYGTYVRLTSCEICDELEFDKIIVHDLKHKFKTVPFVTIFQDFRYQTANVKVKLDRKGVPFFHNDSISWCEGYDCLGLATMTGRFEWDKKKKNQVIWVKAGFYKDVDNIKVREWYEEKIGFYKVRRSPF